MLKKIIVSLLVVTMCMCLVLPSAFATSENIGDVVQYPDGIMPSATPMPPIPNIEKNSLQQENDLVSSSINEDMMAVMATPSISASNITQTSVYLTVTYPDTNAWGNRLEINNRDNGSWIDVTNSYYTKNGTYSYSYLSPGTNYMGRMTWYNGAWYVKDVYFTTQASASGDDSNEFELGIFSITDYVNFTTYPDLNTSTSCVTGINQCPPQILTQKFDYRGTSVWETDFTSSQYGGSDSAYADSVDIMAYCGHGLTSGLFIDHKGSDGNNIVEKEKLRWGDTDMEFALLFTCNSLTDGTNYANAANGLHVLCGFGSTMLVTANGGYQFYNQAVNYGKSVKDAWFDAAYTQQDSGKNRVIRALYHSSTANSSLTSRPSDPPSIWNGGTYYISTLVKP